MERIKENIENFVLGLVIVDVIVLVAAFTARIYGVIPFDLFIGITYGGIFVIGMYAIPIVTMGFELWTLRPEVLRVVAAVASIALFWVTMTQPGLEIKTITYMLSLVMQIMVLRSLFKNTTMSKKGKWVSLVLAIVLAPVYLLWAIYEAYVTRPQR